MNHVELNLRQHNVIEYLKENPGATTAAIASALQIKKEVADGALRGLYTRKLVGRQATLAGLDDWRAVHANNPWRWYANEATS